MRGSTARKVPIWLRINSYQIKNTWAIKVCTLMIMKYETIVLHGRPYIFSSQSVWLLYNTPCAVCGVYVCMWRLCLCYVDPGFQGSPHLPHQTYASQNSPMQRIHGWHETRKLVVTVNIEHLVYMVYLIKSPRPQYILFWQTSLLWHTCICKVHKQQNIHTTICL